MSFSVKRVALSVCAAVLAISTVSTAALAYPPNKSLLESKGYSPLTAQIIDVQAKRQEWKQPPAPERDPKEQIKRNIYINDWTGNMDPFGSYIIRERQ